MLAHDPSHVSACLSSLRCWTGGTVELTVPSRRPASGGVAVRVSRGGGVVWLQAQPGSGGMKYRVRDAEGRELGPVSHQRGGSRLHEACVFVHEVLPPAGGVRC